MHESRYYLFFKDGSSISKMTLKEALSIPYKEYIVKEERSPAYSDKYPSYSHTVLDSEGKELRLRFGDWELIDIPYDNTSFNVYNKTLTYYNHKNEQTYKRLYKGAFNYYFFKEVIGFMKRISSEGGWQIYEYENKIEKLNDDLKKANEEIIRLNAKIERLENPESTKD